MPPKVDISTRRAIEATAVARTVEGKKKRPAAQLSQHDLKRMKRSPWIDPVWEEPTRLELETVQTVLPRAVPFDIPLFEGLGEYLRAGPAST